MEIQYCGDVPAEIIRAWRYGIGWSLEKCINPLTTARSVHVFNPFTTNCLCGLSQKDGANNQVIEVRF